MGEPTKKFHKENRKERREKIKKSFAKKSFKFLSKKGDEKWLMRERKKTTFLAEL